MRQHLPERHFASVAVALLCIVAVLFEMRWAAAAEPSIDDVLKAMVRIDATVPAEARTSKSLGTSRTGHGAIIDENGLIVTIGYLVLEASTVKVTQFDGTEIPASVVAYDNNTGFGLLRTARPLAVKPLTLGNSGRLEPESTALIAGFGGSAAAMPAKIVARRDFAGYWEYLLERAIFTAPPYVDFGGAALIDKSGALVGVGSLIVADAAEPGTYGPGNMFVPINRLKPVLQTLIAKGRTEGPSHPWLGLYTEEVRGHLFVQRVAREGPAEQAGIKAGDIVVGIGDTPVTRQIDFYRKLWSYGAPGVQVPLTILTTEFGVKKVEVESMDRYRWYRMPRGN